MKSRFLLRFLVLLLATTALARADVKLHGLFTDQMILQRDAPVAVWGWALATGLRAVNESQHRRI